MISSSLWPAFSKMYPVGTPELDDLRRTAYEALHEILCDSLIFMHKCTPKFKKYGILVQNWFHRGEKNAI